MPIKVGVLIIVFFLPTLTHAESAWVLWKKTDFTELGGEKTGSHYFWEILNAYPLHKNCQKAQERVWTSIKNSEKEKKNVEITAFPFSIIRSNEHMLSTDAYLCLPETVNPNLFERRRD